MYSIGKSLHVNPFWELKGYDLETDSLKIVWIVVKTMKMPTFPHQVEIYRAWDPEDSAQRW